MQQSKNPFSQQPLPGEGGMSCEQARRQIERLIEEGGLMDVERALLLAHVRGCAACKAELESCRRLEARMKGAFAAVDTTTDFTERLIAALPAAGSREAPGWLREDAEDRGRDPRFPSRTSGARLGSAWKWRWRRAYALPLTILVLALIGGLGAYWRFRGHYAPRDSVPLVADISGAAMRTHGSGGPLPLKVDDPIRDNDIIASGAQPVALTLTSGRLPLARVTLAPNSRLGAVNRHTFKVLAGAAFFNVYKERPGAGSEVFEVDANGLARVLVTGTQFSVDLNAHPFGAVVAVKEGSVLVHPFTTTTAVPSHVNAGDEQIVTANEPPVTRKSDLAARLAWMNPPVAEPPAAEPLAAVAKGRTTSISPRPDPAVPPGPAVDWDAPIVGSLPLAGKTLREGIDMLAETQGRPAELLDLIGKDQALMSRELSFSIYSPPRAPMTVRSALRWLAHDMGMLFEPAPAGNGARFVLPRATDALGPARSGELPESVRIALDRPLAEKLDPALKLHALLDVLGRTSNLTIVADGGQAARYAEKLARRPGVALAGDTVGEKLDALLGTLGLNAAWYDHALFLASPGQIERLTAVERKTPLTVLADANNREWEQALTWLLSRTLAYPAGAVNGAAGRDAGPTVAARGSRLSLRSGEELEKTPVFTANKVRVVREAGGVSLVYSTGVLGDALVAAALARLEKPDPPIVSPVIALTRPAPSGPLENLDPLLKEVHNLMNVKEGVKCPAFGKHALTVKSLSVGEALEWSAWLGNCGIRQEDNTLIVDSLEACYGQPQLQVVPMDDMAGQAGVPAAELQRQFGRLLREIYPGFFDEQSTPLYFLAGRIAFQGDRRQLELALRVRRDLKQDLDAGKALRLDDWKPAWRSRVDQALAASCADVPPLSGSFASALRTSPLSARIRCTVMVDPAAMKEAAGQDIGRIDTAGQSVGQVLERLAAAAGLKMTREGHVVWLHGR